MSNATREDALAAFEYLYQRVSGCPNPGCRACKTQAAKADIVRAALAETRGADAALNAVEATSHADG